MRIILITILLVVMPLHAMYAQSNACADCKLEDLCKQYMQGYFNDQSLPIIKNNWNDYFGADLESTSLGMQTVRTIALKFDAMGCIYPPGFADIPAFKNEFLASNQDPRNFDAASFYHFFQKWLEGSLSADLIELLSSTGFSPSSFNQINTKIGTEIEYFDFIRVWNNKWLNETIISINKEINSSHKKIMVFIHGYNVPYSLAQIQGNTILQTALKLQPEITEKEIVFLRVFWPSGNFKNNLFSDRDCNYNNKEKLSTLFVATYHTNRAYLSGLGLRKILADLKTESPIDIITHSQGAVVASTALINTCSKLQKGFISEGLKSYMNEIALPQKQINVFMNAPSMPGTNTFRDINDTLHPQQRNYRFFVGYNENDLILNKQKLPVLKRVRLARKLSSTTLGCNYKGEIRKTLEELCKKGMQLIFHAGINSYNREHDFFCYMNQPEFTKNLRSFLSGHFR